MVTETSRISLRWTKASMFWTSVRFLILGVLAVIVVLLPTFGLSPYYVRLASEVLIFALFAMSLDLLIGYTGLVSFGHGAYFGLGAYGTGLLINKLGLTVLPAFFGGVVLATVVALLVGIVIVRLSGIAFALLTLAASMVIFTTMWQWTTLTGGDDGMTVRRPAVELGFASISLASNAAFYYFALIVTLLSAGLLWRLTASPMGAALSAVRENAVRAKAIGYNVERLKLISFVIAGMFAGVAGSLYVMLRSFASPELLHWSFSGHVLIMTVVGGVGTLFGPAFGAAMMVIVQEKLSSYTQYWMLPFGLLFVLIVGFLPGGLAQLVRKAKG